MDLSNPWSILSGLIVGLIGMTLFMAGRKQSSPRCLLAGLVLCVAPYAISSVALVWLVVAGCLGWVYAGRSA